MRAGWTVVVVALGCSSTVDGVSASDAGGDASAGSDVLAGGDAVSAKDAVGGALDAGAVTVDEAVASLRAALCEQESRCDDERRFPLLGAPREVVELCARTGLGLRSRLAPPSNDLAVEAARAGRARVDAAALEGCLSAVRAGCDRDGAQAAACDVARYVVGDLPLGSRCSVSVECAEGLWCEVLRTDAGAPPPRPTCSGVCAPRVGDGEACVDTDQCRVPSRGRRGCNRGRCAPVADVHGFRAEGEECLYRDPYNGAQRLACAEGLYCFDERGSAFCRAPLSLGEGELCDRQFYRCGVGLRCAIDDGERDGVCRPGVEPPPPTRGPTAAWGEPCGAGGCVSYTACVGDVSAPGAPARCRLLVPAAVGEACGVDPRHVRRCDSDSRCEAGVCARRSEIVIVGEGETCADDARCAEGFFCSGVTGCTRTRPDGATCTSRFQCEGGACVPVAGPMGLPVGARCAPAFCPR